MEIERQAAVALKWNTAARLASQALTWTITLVVLRLLAPADYGLMAVSAVIISIVAGMAEFGLGASLVQSQRLAHEELSRLAGAIGILNLACGALVVLAAPLLATAAGEPRLEAIIRVASLQFVLYAIEAVPQSLLQREMNFKKAGAIELSATVAGALTTLLLAWLDAGVWALVWGNLAGGAVRTALLVTLGTFMRPKLHLAGLSRHLRFGGLVTATRFLWQATHQLDTLIAARFLSPAAVGLYSVSMHLATLPMNKTMGIVNQVAFPAVARLQDEPSRLRARLLEALRLLAFVAIPALWGLSVIATEFVDVVLGEKWRTAARALQLVSLVAPLRMLMAVLATAVQAIGRVEIELRNTLVSALVLPICFFIGVRWELDGLAASWLVAIPLTLLCNFRRTSRALQLTLRDLATAIHGPLLGGAAMYATVSAMRLPLIDLDEGLRLPVLITAGAVSYLAVVRAIDPSIWLDVRRLAAAVRG
jgi:teichuronic acid exporter